jgi:hypothetical protein
MKKKNLKHRGIYIKFYAIYVVVDLDYVKKTINIRFL